MLGESPAEKEPIEPVEVPAAKLNILATLEGRALLASLSRICLSISSIYFNSISGMMHEYHLKSSVDNL